MHRTATRETVRPGTWTGQLELDIRNGRDWAAGSVGISVGRDTVAVRHQGRLLAVLDRDRFRYWLLQVEPRVMEVDQTAWSMQAGVTCMTVGAATYTVTGDSLTDLLTVI